MAFADVSNVFFSLNDSVGGSSGGKNWWVVMTTLLPLDLSLSLSSSLWKNWWVLTTLLSICIFCGHSLFRKRQSGYREYWCVAPTPNSVSGSVRKPLKEIRKLLCLIVWFSFTQTTTTPRWFVPILIIKSYQMRIYS